MCMYWNYLHSNRHEKPLLCLEYDYIHLTCMHVNVQSHILIIRITLMMRQTCNDPEWRNNVSKEKRQKSTAVGFFIALQHVFYIGSFHPPFLNSMPFVLISNPLLNFPFLLLLLKALGSPFVAVWIRVTFFPIFICEIYRNFMIHGNKLKNKSKCEQIYYRSLLVF